MTITGSPSHRAPAGSHHQSTHVSPPSTTPSARETPRGRMDRPAYPTMKPTGLTWQEHYISNGRDDHVLHLHAQGRTGSSLPSLRGVKYAEDHQQRLIALSRFPCFPSAERTVVIDRTDDSATNRSIYPSNRRNLPGIALTPCSPSPPSPSTSEDSTAHDARFRWTSLEVERSQKPRSRPLHPAVV